MKTFNLSALAALLFGAALLSAQTATPSTTLSAAQSATQTTVCLTATTGVVNQTGIYVDNEYEVATISNNTTVAAGPSCFPVLRNARSAGSGPTAHTSLAIAWIAYTPATSLVPGSNGFFPTSTMFAVGPCTRASQLYLPLVFPGLNVMRDCNQSVGAPNGQWVNFNDGNSQKPSPTPLVALTTNGAVAPVSGNYVITKAGVLAMTLAAPTAGIQDGTIIVITNNTANAHTLTATGLLQTGTATVNLATFAAFAGSTITLEAYGGKWNVISSTAVVLS